jgi:hypothetical protein
MGLKVHDVSMLGVAFIILIRLLNRNPIYIVTYTVLIKMIILQLICDSCKKVILEKEGESYLNQERFPISNQEAMMLDEEHRGHECHIEAVEKEV